MLIFAVGVVGMLGAVALFIVAQVFEWAIYNESLPSIAEYYEKQKRKYNMIGLVLLVLGFCAFVVALVGVPGIRSELHQSMKAIAAILLFIALVVSIPFAAIAFGISSRSSGFAFFLNLVFTGIALAVIFRFEQFFVPQIWTAVLGVVAVIIGVWLFRASQAHAERDVANTDYYFSPRPVHEKLLRMSPGCFLIAQATAYSLLGAAILFAQAVATFF